MAQTFINDPEFGRICLRTRAGSSRLSAKWAKGIVVITIPAISGMDMKRVSDFLEASRPWLRAHCPGIMLAHGSRLDLGDGCFYVFERGKVEGVEGRLTPDRRGVVITYSDRFQADDPVLARAVSNVMVRSSIAFAERLLLAPCREEALRLGLRPRLIEISTGHRILGTCSTRGEIRLSRVCVFLSPELRRYIFCHELAHLTHHDHSAAFHKLLDTYLDGREASLTRALHTFSWPILR